MSITEFGNAGNIDLSLLDRQGYAPVSQGDDKKLFVNFYDKEVRNPTKSAEMGRPFFDKVCFVRIQEPGNNLTVTDRPAQENDKRRFPEHWRFYVEGRTNEQPGTPVDVLFPYSPEVVATLRHMKIPTVELLAGMSDTTKGLLGLGADEYQKKAAQFLDAAKSGAENSHLRSELAKRDQTIAAMQAQIAEIQRMQVAQGIQPMPLAQGFAVEPDPIAEPRRGPGRPRKEPFAA